MTATAMNKGLKQVKLPISLDTRAHLFLSYHLVYESTMVAAPLYFQERRQCECKPRDLHQSL